MRTFEAVGAECGKSEIKGSVFRLKTAVHYSFGRAVVGTDFYSFLVEIIACHSSSFHRLIVMCPFQVDILRGGKGISGNEKAERDEE